MEDNINNGLQGNTRAVLDVLLVVTNILIDQSVVSLDTLEKRLERIINSPSIEGTDRQILLRNFQKKICDRQSPSQKLHP